MIRMLRIGNVVSLSGLAQEQLSLSTKVTFQGNSLKCGAKLHRIRYADKLEEISISSVVY
jgi:hypothetical protein